MRYLVVQHEIAYITKYDGEGIEDSWDAPEGKLFKPMERQIADDVKLSDLVKDIVLVDCR